MESPVLISALLAFTTISEVALVPESTARTYSYIVYVNSVMGYTVMVETIRKTIVLTIRLIAFSTALMRFM